MGSRGPLPSGTNIRALPPSKRPGKPDTEPVAAEPDMPEGMPPLAVAEWRRLAGPLVKAGMLTALDRATLAGYCRNWARLQVVEAELAAMQARAIEGGTPEAAAFVDIGSAGQARASALVALAVRLTAEVDRAGALFGLHPAARARLAPGTRASPPAKSTDRFFRNGD